VAAQAVIDIVVATSAEQLDQVRALFEEYWNSFGFTPCFQGFSEELAALPGKYATPRGRLALLLSDGVAAGCGAFRPIDGQRCEIKRVYVRPEFRGRGIGRALLTWLIDEARRESYRQMLADTMPVMREALQMYDRTGFERIGPYAPGATPGAIYLLLKL